MTDMVAQAKRVPLRTCVVCRNKAEKKELVGMFVLGGNIVYDLGNKVERRKCYVCWDSECLNETSRWLSRKLKREKSKAGS